MPPERGSSVIDRHDFERRIAAAIEYGWLRRGVAMPPAQSACRAMQVSRALPGLFHDNDISIGEKDAQLE